MGATGASSMEDVKTGPPAWEGALWPTLVESKDFYSKDSRPLVIEEVRPLDLNIIEEMLDVF